MPNHLYSVVFHSVLVVLRNNSSVMTQTSDAILLVLSCHSHRSSGYTVLRTRFFIYTHKMHYTSASTLILSNMASANVQERLVMYISLEFNFKLLTSTRNLCPEGLLLWSGQKATWSTNTEMHFRRGGINHAEKLLTPMFVNYHGSNNRYKFHDIAATDRNDGRYVSIGSGELICTLS